MAGADHDYDCLYTTSFRRVQKYSDLFKYSSPKQRPPWPGVVAWLARQIKSTPRRRLDKLDGFAKIFFTMPAPIDPMLPTEIPQQNWFQRCWFYYRNHFRFAVESGIQKCHWGECILGLFKRWHGICRTCV